MSSALNTCDFCAGKGAKTEAVIFCVQCQEYLCTKCMAFHNNFPAMTGHELLGKTQFGSLKEGVSTSSAVPTDKCAKHPTKLIDMFCGSHDAVFCNACVTAFHRSCDDIHYIPDIIETKLNPEIVSKVKADAEQATKQVDKLRKLYKKTASELEQSSKSTLMQIQTFRKQINEKLDELEKRAREDIESKYKELDNDLKVHIQRLNKLIQELEQHIDKLTSTNKNKPQLFVSIKICQKMTADACQGMKEFKKSLPKCLSFSINNAVMNFFDKLKSLGEIFVEYTTFKEIRFLCTVKQAFRFNVKVKDDQNTCNIMGSCVLNPEVILLADNWNKKLKLFETKSNTVSSYCSLPASPRAVCAVSSLEAAVSLENNTIQFISVGSKLTPKRSLQLEHNCYGLAVIDGEMYISDYSTNIYVHALDGKILRIVNQDQSGQQIFLQSFHVVASSDNQMIHVADLYKGLITLNKQGHVLWKFSGSDLKYAWGVCSDANGNVFVCDFNSHNVLQIGEDSKRMGAVFTESHGIKNPQSVCFDKAKTRLIVTCSENNNIDIFLL